MKTFVTAIGNLGARFAQRSRLRATSDGSLFFIIRRRTTGTGNTVCQRGEKLGTSSVTSIAPTVNQKTRKTASGIRSACFVAKDRPEGRKSGDATLPPGVPWVEVNGLKCGRALQGRRGIGCCVGRRDLRRVVNDPACGESTGGRGKRHRMPSR